MNMLNQIKSYIRSKPHLNRIANRIRVTIVSTKSTFDWRKLSKSKEIRLELGSGPKKGRNGYTTVDILGADIYRDLRNGIPLGDNTVNSLYTSHMFEHIPFKQLIAFLRECRRVLKPGGTLSVCVPNARNYIQAYIEKRQFLNSDKFYEPAAIDTGSFLDQVNYIAYMDGQHCYLFDEENLINTLKLAGFSEASLRNFDSTIDLTERDFESIYALATK